MQQAFGEISYVCVVSDPTFVTSQLDKLRERASERGVSVCLRLGLHNFPVKKKTERRELVPYFFLLLLSFHFVVCFFFIFGLSQNDFVTCLWLPLVFVLQIGTSLKTLFFQVLFHFTF
jgi:hypothetical protein